jgi:DNA mismatch endonuclease, patch repair protein
MDTVSPSERSKIMSRVRSKGNKSTEAVLLAAFKARKITGWRRQYPIIGTPDFCFQKHKLAVFIDGCFWHGCPKHCRVPESNRDYWVRKISRNVQHDVIVGKGLRKAKWKVIRIWEHDISGVGLIRKVNQIKKIVQQTPAPLRLARSGRAEGEA